MPRRLTRRRSGLVKRLLFFKRAGKGGVFRRQGQRPFNRLDCFVKFPRFRIGRRQRPQETGFFPRGQLIGPLRHSMALSPSRREGSGPAASNHARLLQAGAMVRLGFQRAFVIRDRLGLAALLGEYIAELVMRVGQIGGGSPAPFYID